jgi:hypothetical protein
MARRPRKQPPQPASAASAAYQKLLEALATENQTHKQSLARRFEPALNAYLETQAPGNADQKKELAQRISADLKRLGLGIHHPDTDQPCALMAASGKANRLGFFLLMPKGSKKAISPRANLADLLPVRLMPDTPRREPLAERRARKRKNGGQP